MISHNHKIQVNPCTDTKHWHCNPFLKTTINFFLSTLNDAAGRKVIQFKIFPLVLYWRESWPPLPWWATSRTVLKLSEELSLPGSYTYLPIVNRFRIFTFNDAFESLSFALTLLCSVAQPTHFSCHPKRHFRLSGFLDYIRESISSNWCHTRCL